MDLTYHYAIARQRQLLSDAARLRTEQRSLVRSARAAIGRRHARRSLATQPVPCPTC